MTKFGVSRSWFIFALCLFYASNGHAQSEGDSDHARLMQTLNITQLRRGADGDPNSPHAANYDEAKANGKLHTLPNILHAKGKQKITSADDWWTFARPQLLETFDREIYGRLPSNVPAVAWQVVASEQAELAGHTIIVRKLRGRVDNSAYPQISVNIELSISTPAHANSAVPLVMELGMSPEFLARLRERFSEEQIQSFMGGGRDWREQVIEKGWGFAELIPTSVQADNGEGLNSGIIGLVNKGKPRKPDDWGALRAWAWSASKAMDFFESDKRVDAKRVAIAGHSRYGKATLVALAYDQRFASGFISSSGEGGAKLWRRHFGEQVGNIAGSGEYHWVAGNFLKYASTMDVEDLPVDAHQLIALCAPRPVFISSGSFNGDSWVDPKGMFLAAFHAGPIYALLGKKGLAKKAFPDIGVSLAENDIAWRQHHAGHTPGPNWEHFLRFVSAYF